MSLVGILMYLCFQVPAHYEICEVDLISQPECLRSAFATGLFNFFKRKQLLYNSITQCDRYAKQKHTERVNMINQHYDTNDMTNCQC